MSGGTVITNKKVEKKLVINGLTLFYYKNLKRRNEL